MIQRGIAMEDLVPLLIFIVIAVINVLKYQAEKKGKGKQPPAGPEEARPQRQPSSLAEFFEEIAQKFDPKPTPQPDWPESIERPDYMQEMEEFERTQSEVFEEAEPAIVIPASPQKKPAPVMPLEVPRAEAPIIQTATKLTAFKLPSHGAVFAGLSGTRISTPTLLRSAGGQIDFDLNGRKQLKQAIIASMIFGPPRGYETSFDNTIAK
jgi:hypothetical protein